jgi:hypothetical protein
MTDVIRLSRRKRATIEWLLKVEYDSTERTSMSSKIILHSSTGCVHVQLYHRHTPARHHTLKYDSKQPHMNGTISISGTIYNKFLSLSQNVRKTQQPSARVVKAKAAGAVTVAGPSRRSLGQRSKRCRKSNSEPTFTANSSSRRSTARSSRSSWSSSCSIMCSSNCSQSAASATSHNHSRSGDTSLIVTTRHNNVTEPSHHDDIPDRLEMLIAIASRRGSLSQAGGLVEKKKLQQQRTTVTVTETKSIRKSSDSKTQTETTSSKTKPCSPSESKSRRHSQDKIPGLAAANNVKVKTSPYAEIHPSRVSNRAKRGVRARLNVRRRFPTEISKRNLVRIRHPMT